ncbi:MAG TPA: hypothetical protein GXZ61_01315 [Clostridiales bacterium]|nr:hypothetical protein [Clostridiales bacterium]
MIAGFGSLARIAKYCFATLYKYCNENSTKHTMGVYVRPITLCECSTTPRNALSWNSALNQNGRGM